VIPPHPNAQLRVLHVSRFYHPHVGGTENFIAHLADAVAEHGIASSVLTTDRYAEDSGPAPRVPVTRLPAIGSDRLPLPRGRMRNVFAAVGNTDIIHVHDLRFLFELVTTAGALRQVPVVLSSHGFIFHTTRTRRMKEIAWRSYYRMLLGRCSLVLCDSEHDLAACRRARLTNARLWPIPVRTDPFEDVQPETRDGNALLYFGRIAPNKGIERLPAVLDRAPQTWVLTVAGSGDERYVNILRRLFTRFGPRVTFTGPVPDEELRPLLARHACIVLPSTAEGFGITLVEALASGVPVVASDIPSYREIARRSPARLVDFDKADAVVECVTSAVRGWDRAAARRRAREFSWHRRAPDLAAIYRALAHG
jgi:alpha-1,3-mannosyltransferase